MQFVTFLLLLLWSTSVFSSENSEKVIGGKGWKNKNNHAFAATKEKVPVAELQRISERIRNYFPQIQSGTCQAGKQSAIAQNWSVLAGKQTSMLGNFQQKSERRSWKILFDKKHGTARHISIGAGQPGGLTSSAVRTAAETAIRFIESNRDLFKLTAPRSELQQIEEATDRLGKKHIKFRQTFAGIPVWGKDMVAHFDADNSLYLLNAHSVPTPADVNVNQFAVSKKEALSIAHSALENSSSKIALGNFTAKALDFEKATATKMIWQDEAGRPRLIWHVQMRPNLRDNWYFFIDANSMTILEKYNATMFDGPTTASATDANGSQRTINVYESGSNFFMIDASRPIFQAAQPDILNDPKGALWTISAQNTDLNENVQLAHVASNDNTWNDTVAVSGHDNVAKVFEYYFNVHGRKAIDDSGSTIISIMHVTDEGNGMDNAFWNGIAMAYGDGNQAFKPLAGALDVAAHEMTHGVIQHTVNLEYKFQSGALNESLADVFGAMVDRDDWKMGEDVVLTSAFPSGALRDMEDPHNGANSINEPGWQPAHMNEFLNLTIEQDNGGVHINSGIPNKACQLIGAAIGKDKTEDIYYRVMDARYLNSQSNFVDMRLGAIQAATDLYGAQSTETNAVKSAFDAVGITGTEGTKPPDDTPAVAGEEWIAIVNAESEDTSIFLVKPVIQNPGTDIVQLTTTQVYTGTGNPISVTDDGSVILFVDSDNFIRAINSNGSAETVISTDGVWNSIALSPDGTLLAATSNPNIVAADTTIYIFDLVNSANSKAVKLYTPTTGQGATTNITQFADALDWDLSGQFVLYDAFNSIPKQGGGSIDYWDVNLLDVASGVIVPVFPPQQEGISIGNPSFAQTNDAFVVFDYIDFNQSLDVIMAANLFSGVVETIEANGSSIGFPRYAADDSHIVFERGDAGQNAINVRQIAITERQKPSGSSFDYVSDGQRPTWFAIGQRPTSVDEPDQTVPQAYSLEQNYPNPFNPTTTIQFSTAKAENVTIKLFDVLGREIATLVDGYYEPGQHKTIFAAGKLTSGLYVYRIQAGNFTQSRKLLLLK